MIVLAAGEVAGGIAVWVPVAVAIVGTGGTFLGYKLAKRKASGLIDTTEASELWAESRAIRDGLREEAETLRQEVVSLRKEAASMREEMVQLRQEAASLRNESADLRRSREECQAEADRFRRLAEEYRVKLVAAGLMADRRQDS